jgi:hypothetical protein
MKITAIVLVLVFISVDTFAWDRKAHKIIAQIAKSRVDKNTAELVDHYLQGMSWEDAACWLDSIRGNPKNDYMKPWHYINFEKDKTYVKTREVNIINQLELCFNMLQKKSFLTTELINQQLKNLFHLVGDLHQPLHCAYASDQGGNLQMVKFLNKPSNLHKVWDSQIIDEKGIDIWSCSKVLMGLQQKEITEIQKIDPVAWMNESRSLLPKVYDFKNGNIDQLYLDQNATVINIQLTKAGLRLATVINKYFKA